jgi:hypothetical protein
MTHKLKINKQHLMFIIIRLRISWYFKGKRYPLSLSEITTDTDGQGDMKYLTSRIGYAQEESMEG